VSACLAEPREKPTTEILTLKWFRTCQFPIRPQHSSVPISASTSSFLSSHLLLWPPTAPLLSGCQAKVTIFFRVLGSAFLLSVGFFSLFIFTPSPNYRIFFLSSGGGIFDWTGVRREIFTVSDLCGFLKLIIPHWAQPWHCRERHKSSDSCCWACANPGECFFLACFFPSIHFFVLISSAPLFDIFSLIPLTFSVFPFY